jgi:hypothetical protein
LKVFYVNATPPPPGVIALNRHVKLGGLIVCFTDVTMAEEYLINRKTGNQMDLGNTGIKHYQAENK